MKFDELVKEPALLRAIRELGWEEPTPIQAQAIPPAREGRDVVGIAQTGTGKTAAFLIPALERQIHREGLYTLVLCPTRELAQQVAASARELLRYTELWVGEIVGGMPMDRQIRDLLAGFDVLVATPGRLLDHLERGTVDLSTVEVVVLDEADRMLDMGFRPQIDAILRSCPKQRQTMLFSATMPNGVHALALRILKDPVQVSATPRIVAAETVEQVLYPVRPERKVDLLLHLLENPDLDQVLVFTRTKAGADLLLQRLRAAGVDAAVLHGDKAMRERMSALEKFAEGRVRVLVATDVAQRGLDIEGISHVINYDVPQEPEDYVHRIGRTGRAGARGSAVTFMAGADVTHVHAIERMLGYRIPRRSLEGYDYAGAPAVPAESAAPVPQATPRVSRGRLGSRRGQLSPEALRELLRVG